MCHIFTDLRVLLPEKKQYLISICWSVNIENGHCLVHVVNNKYGNEYQGTRKLNMGNIYIERVQDPKTREQ